MPENSASRAGHEDPRRFDFWRDSFAFANELVWEYHFDSTTGKTLFRPRQPRPDYSHRCFVLVRAARQFLYHAAFNPAERPADDATYRRLIRQIMARSPRRAAGPGSQILIPGYESLRQFSREKAELLKAECGGAWRSYFLRSHWRMVFPVSRRHQQRTVEQLAADLNAGLAPIAHLVRFPALTINHGMILFDRVENGSEVEFLAYDPNDPDEPSRLTYERATNQFSLPRNRYWAGGGLNIIHIYRGWLL